MSRVSALLRVHVAVGNWVTYFSDIIFGFEVAVGIS